MGIRNFISEPYAGPHQDKELNNGIFRRRHPHAMLDSEVGHECRNGSGQWPKPNMDRVRKAANVESDKTRRFPIEARLGRFVRSRFATTIEQA